MKEKGRGRADRPWRQELFIREYLVDLNATAAYVRAGYKARGHSAGASAHALLRNPDIRARVREEMAARAERVGVKADDVLAELLLVMKSDIRHYEVTREGRLALAPEAEGKPEVGRAVARLRHKVRRFFEKDGAGEGQEVEVEEVELGLWDKVAAIELAGKHLGLFPTRLAVEDPRGRLAELLGVPKDSLPES